MKSSTDSVFVLLKRAAEGFAADHGFRLSAALAYYAAFSLAPLLLIALSVAGLAVGDEAATGAFYDELGGTLGTAGAELVQEMVAHARRPGKSVAMTLVGTALLLVGAAGLFGQLQSAFDTIWNVGGRSRRGIAGFIKERFLSFTMVLGTGFLLLVSMLLSTMLHVFSMRVGEIASIPSPVWAAAGGVLSFVVVTLLFAAIFKVLPHAVVHWHEVWVGAIVTSGMFAVGKSVLAWYLGREAIISSYGSAGAMVAVLLWLHYTSAILLFGAEFTQVYARAQGREIVGR